MRSASLLLLASVAIGLASAQESAVKKDLEKFQGSWQATYVVDLNGSRASADDIKNTRLVVQGNKFTLQTSTAVVKGTFTIDPTRSPKTIDFVLENQKPDAKFLGIYRIDGDERSSCFSPPGKDRPGELDPKATGYLQFGWKRQTP